MDNSHNSKINFAIDTCDPALLLDVLINASVKNEGDRNNAKLLGKIKDVYGKGISFINNKLAEIEKAETSNLAKSAGDSLIEIPEATFREPNGKFSCSISVSGIHLNGIGANKFSCFIPLDFISHMAVVPNNMTTKKEGEDYLVIRLSQPVKYNGKDLRSFLWVLAKTELKPPLSEIKTENSSNSNSSINSSGGGGSGDNVSKTTESGKVSSTLESLCPRIKLIKPNIDLFKSITKQKSYVNCYKGVQEGVLYPLENGLLFVKPLHFIPLEDIASMVAGRGGGSNTRFVDLAVETFDQKTTEFTNFEREELGSLQWYINWLVKTKKKQAAALEAQATAVVKREDKVKDENNGGGIVSSMNCDDASDDDDDDDDDGNKGVYFKDDEDSDDEEDDDYNPEGGSSDGSGSNDESSDDDSGSAFSWSNSGSDKGSSGSDDECIEVSKSKSKSSKIKSKRALAEDDASTNSDASEKSDSKNKSPKKRAKSTNKSD